MFNLREVLGELPPIKIVDAGAMALGGAEEPYFPLISEGLATVIGFEPVDAECVKLNASARPGATYLPYAIGNGKRATLHVCNYSMTSSIYEPNTPLLSLFQNLENLTRVMHRVDLETHRLDDIKEVRGADYIKLDVQGAELDVLNGAPETLANVVCVQTEVEFVPLYLGQPLFAEVDQAMRRNGFLLHRFLHMAGRAYQPVTVEGDINRPLNQVLWADVVYVRDFTRFDDLTPEQLLKLATILHVVYKSFDLVAHALSRYDLKKGTDHGAQYLQRLTRPPVPAGTWNFAG